MFFKWPSKNKSVPASTALVAKESATPKAREGEKNAPLAKHALAAGDLRKVVDAAGLGCKTSAELTSLDELLGQERAVRALEFGVAIDASLYNIVVVGPKGSGKSTAVKRVLDAAAAKRTAPSDWIYAPRFEERSTDAQALALPHGRGPSFATAFAGAIEDLTSRLPRAFEGEHYQAHRRAIEEEFRSRHDELIDELSRKAGKQNIALLRTPLGFALAPMHEGRVVKPEVFNQLPQSMRREVEARIEALEKELTGILEASPKTEAERMARLKALHEEIAGAAVADALEAASKAFADVPQAAQFLADAERDLVRHFDLFIAGASGSAIEARYGLANVVSQGARKGAPIVEVFDPSAEDLFGRTGLAADGSFSLRTLTSGALHRANGGYLVIDVGAQFIGSAAWLGLKRALRTRELSVGWGEPARSALSPIPLSVKVVLLGDRETLARLAADDPDCEALFKVTAEFDDAIQRTPEAERSYARLVAGLAKAQNCLPIEAAGLALVVEEAARRAGDREKLSLDAGRVAEVVLEADYWARKDTKLNIRRADIEKAIETKLRRADRLKDQAQEAIERGLVQLDTDGSKIGQINALAMAGVGDMAFSRPTRISARVAVGKGRVTDIEREAQLGGPLHSKGVMILWGYLAGTFASTHPLALSASLVFEQSYGPVDGDSASAAELLALLSSLADAPLRQDLAVTGAIDQWGELQAVGGICEKIEGFFDVCQARGLSGKQGVIIPKANVPGLMLRDDIVESVREQWFTVYAVSSVAEAVELMTGIDAGVAGPKGYPKESIFGRVAEKLSLFASAQRGRDSGGRASP